MKSLPAKIEAVSGQVAVLEKKLSDPAFFNRDPNGFNKASAELEKLRAEIDAMEHEWLELEMLKSQIEAG